jgi:hypothetical protein
LRHGRHPLYPVMLGVPVSLNPDEVSAGKPPICGDPHVCNKCPLQKAEDTQPTPHQANCAAEKIELALRCGLHFAEIGSGLGVGLSSCATAGEFPAGPASAGTCAAIVGATMGPPTVLTEGLLVNQCIKEFKDLEQSCGP